MTAIIFGPLTAGFSACFRGRRCFTNFLESCCKAFKPRLDFGVGVLPLDPFARPGRVMIEQTDFCAAGAVACLRVSSGEAELRAGEVGRRVTHPSVAVRIQARREADSADVRHGIAMGLPVGFWSWLMEGYGLDGFVGLSRGRKFFSPGDRSGKNVHHLPLVRGRQLDVRVVTRLWIAIDQWVMKKGRRRDAVNTLWDFSVKLTRSGRGVLRPVTLYCARLRRPHFLWERSGNSWKCKFYQTNPPRKLRKQRAGSRMELFLRGDVPKTNPTFDKADGTRNCIRSYAKKRRSSKQAPWLCPFQPDADLRNPPRRERLSILTEPFLELGIW